MTYVLCDAEDCINHDGNDCTLEAVSLQLQADNLLACLDCELEEEGDEQ